MREYRYTIILHPEPEEGGYSVTVPAFPGCFAQGETVEEAIGMGKEAIAAHIQGLLEDGEPVPEEDGTLIAVVKVASQDPNKGGPMNNNNHVNGNNVKDKEIFKILEKDARTTPEQIATMTGLPLEEVTSIIKKAEKDRVIVGYKTIINWDKLGDDLVWAIIEVKVLPQRNVGFDAIAQRVYRFPQAHTVYLVSGTYDFAVLVRGKTMQEVAAFVSEKLAPLDGVQATVTHFLLKRFKVDGEILEGEEKGKRLPVTL